MNIDPKSKIAGLPAIKIRDFLRLCRDSSWSIEFVVSHLEISKPKANDILRQLIKLGYVQKDDMHRNRNLWTRTLAGSTLALASAAPKFKRKTACQKLIEFVSRVKSLNNSSHYLYFVSKVFLFGSMLEETDRVSDVDVAVELTPKFKLPSRQFKAEREHTAAALKSGKNLTTFMAQICWPKNEVLLFLKSRCRVISLHETTDLILRQTETRVVYEFRKRRRSL